MRAALRRRQHRVVKRRLRRVERRQRDQRRGKRRVARETDHDITRKLIQIGIRQAGE